MANLFSSQDLADFNRVMQDAADTFIQKPVLWRRVVSFANRFMEDTQDSPPVVPVQLKCLINYNYLRSWPITQSTESGELDRQSIQVLFSRKALDDAGYINSEGYFDYNSDLDRFEIDGLVYKPVGDTPASQVQSSDLLFTIIMKREETETGDKR